MMNYKWYLMVLGQYMTILAGTWSVKVGTGTGISLILIGGTRSAKGLYACIYWKKWRFDRVLPTPH